MGGRAAVHRIPLAVAGPPCAVGTRGEERTTAKMRRGVKEERRKRGQEGRQRLTHGQRMKISVLGITGPNFSNN